jgi:hypothetical protein
MSRLCRQWTEKFDASFDRGLTARPVVLAKTYEPGALRSRNVVAFRARRPHEGSGNAGRFGAGSAVRSGSGFDPVASCRFRTVKSFIGCLDDFFRRWVFPP